MAQTQTQDPPPPPTHTHTHTQACINARMSLWRHKHTLLYITIHVKYNGRTEKHYVKNAVRKMCLHSLSNVHQTKAWYIPFEYSVLDTRVWCRSLGHEEAKRTTFRVKYIEVFPTRIVYLYYKSCLRYTILVGNPRYIIQPPRWPSGKASASRVEDPGFESCLRQDFFRVESYQWLKNWHSSGYPARRLAM